MSSSPYERWNPFCNYVQSIYCHSPSLPIGRMRVQGATCWYGNPQLPRTIGQRQPAHDYASNQCLAMLVFFFLGGGSNQPDEQQKGRIRRAGKINRQQKGKIVGIKVI